MVDLAGEFAVSLKAYTGVDASSLRRSEKQVADALGKPIAGVRVTPDARSWQREAGKLKAPVSVAPDLRSWQKAVSQLGKAIPAGAVNSVSQKLWGAAGGQVRSLNEVRKASLAAAREAGHVAAARGRIKTRLTESWHLDGFGRAVEQFRAGRKELTDFSDKAEGVGKLFGPASALAGIGSAAGIGAIVEGFGSRAGMLERTAAGIGVSTDMLQNWSGAAELAGLNAEGAIGAISAFSRTMFLARLGHPAGAAARGSAALLDLDVNAPIDQGLKDLSGKIKEVETTLGRKGRSKE